MTFLFFLLFVAGGGILCCYTGVGSVHGQDEANPAP